MSKYEVFFGTYSKGAGNGVFRGEFDNGSGEIRLCSTLDIENPSYLQLRQNILYGVSETNDYNGENGGALFSIDVAAEKEMALIDIQHTHGKHPCHVCVQDRFVFVSNYSEGSLSLFESGLSGGIKSSFQSIHHFGKSEKKDRQEASHVHFAAMTRCAQFLAVCDLGMDKVLLYPYSAENGLSAHCRVIDCPPGSGPRHLVFSKCGRYLYVLAELSNTVLCYEYNQGEAKLLQEVSTLPPDFTGKSAAAAIRLSPDGLYVAASNRGHDSIAVFAVGGDGKLSFKFHLMTGREPRDFNYSPCGQWMLAANQNGDSVAVYRMENSAFKQTGSVTIPKPVCILFGGIRG
jgi:6-phosphogluconolactonase